MFLRGECRSVSYQPGSYETVKTSAGIEPDTVRINGIRYANRGTGFAERITPSQLILYAEVRGRLAAIYIDRYFKEKWGRLTAKRREAIQATMPEVIAVSEHMSPTGGRYYEALDDALAQWLTRAQAYKP